MKKLIFTLIIIGSALFADSQAWKKNLPREKVENRTVNFFDIQKAFYDYCDENKVKNGYFEEDGERKQLSGYKHFKRWEYNWASMVDQNTGEFPSIDAQDLITAAKEWKSSSSKSAGSWESIGISDNKRVGRVNCIAFHPDLHDVIYAGTPGGGLWKTTDHGTTWKCLTDDLPTLGVSAIVIKPNIGGDILYIGTGDRDVGMIPTFSVGVLKSNDGGETWETTGLSFNANQGVQVTGLIMHPFHSDTVFATTNNGFYITSDGGVTWPLVSTPTMNLNFIDIELHPNLPNHIYLSTLSNSFDSTYIFRSMDMGVSWDIIFREEGLRTEMTISTDPSKPKWMYAVVAKKDRSLSAVYKFLNGGSSSLKILDGDDKNLLGRQKNGMDFGEGQGEYDLAIAVDPNEGNRLFIGGINTFVSEDGWNWEWDNFDNVSQIWLVSKQYRSHADKHQLIFRPGTSELYECNDGGIFRRIGKRNWEGLSEGMTISQMYRLGLNSTEANKLLAGLQDNGTHEYKSGWNKVHHSDGMECIIDYEKPSVQYASSQNGMVVRTTVAWYGFSPAYIVKNWWENFHNGIDETESAEWVTPYILDPEDRKTLYIGLENIWKSTNQGGHWDVISSFGIDNNQFDALAIAPSNPNYIYASRGDDLFVTKDSGESWDDISPGFTITYIAVSNKKPSTVWVTSGGFDDDNVQVSTDAGETWSVISEGLPPVPVYCIVQNKRSEFGYELYAGTYSGVYRKVGQTEWEPYNYGLPNVQVNELEIYYSGYSIGGIPEKEHLYAATFGRGMWRSELIDADTRFWTGAESYNWDDIDNWSPKELPTPSTDVYIPEGCPNWPIIQFLNIGESLAGSSCKNLRLYESSELTVGQQLYIGEGAKLICDSLSNLFIGGAWVNFNDAAHIEDGFGFTPEPTSEVIFTYQHPAPVTCTYGSESFQILTIDKNPYPSPYPFNPFCSIIVYDTCRINKGTWEDASPLIHQFYGHFIVQNNGILTMDPGSVLEFIGQNPQDLIFKSSGPYTSFNYISSIKVEGATLNQLDNLASVSAIRSQLIIDEGSVYQVGDLETQVNGSVTIKNTGRISLDKTTLKIAGLVVFPGGTFHSSGIEGNEAQVVPSGISSFSFNVRGLIESSFTSFSGMNPSGIKIVGPNSFINMLDNCTFTSSGSTDSLLVINNVQDVDIHNNTFNVSGSQKSVSKTVGTGYVDVWYWSPSNANLYEGDCCDRIDWKTGDKSTLATTETLTLSDISEKIRIYPNPSSGPFIIEYNPKISEPTTIEIIDLNGQLVYTSNLERGKTTISTDKYKKGIYLLKIIMSEHIIVKRIVLQ